ncbi:MAG: GNAT family N-acetyltransferase [Armatimonadetes bacterium]|nr:GNAT family N-acetyltransferase [Armatimonadota bacterium]
MQELVSERLCLRPLGPEDVDALFAIFADEQTVAFTEWEPFQTLADAEWLLDWATKTARQEPRTVFVWGVHWRDTDAELLGMVSLTIRNPASRQADVGYILHRSIWGQGIATEAARLVVVTAFNALSLHRISGECHPENEASMRVLEKVGMKREGCLRQNKWEKGRWRDTAVYALLESDEQPSQRT